MHRVFVYGTLKRGFPNHDAGMKDVRCLGRFRTVEPFPLVVGGTWFSPYLIDEPGKGMRVFGEIFEIDDDGLAKLDCMEGTHLSNGYSRISIGIEGANGSFPFDAWTYVKRRDAIEGIHSEPLDEYLPDPRYVVPANRTCEF